MFVVFGIPVFSDRDRTEPDRAGGVAIGIGEVRRDDDARDGRWLARKKLVAFGVVLSELFVGLEHADN